jgi:hypothetical protein
MSNDASNQGCWTAMATFSPLRARQAFFKAIEWRISLWLAGVGIRRPIRLRKLSMIGFARWSIVKKAPQASKGGRIGKLRTPYILFETNFNGDNDNYLEAFSLVTTKGISKMWSGTYGLPDIATVSNFQKFVNDNKFDITRYHAAYRVDSTKMVRSALLLKQLHDELNPTVEQLNEKQFLEAYTNFLAAAQQKDPPNPPTPGRALPKTQALSVLTPIDMGGKPALRAAIDGAPADWAPPSSHFARWVIVDQLKPAPGRPPDPDSYLIFSAWFDGPQERYLRQLHERLGDVTVERIWGPDYPGGGPEAFSDYLLDHQLEVGVPFSAYDGVTVREVKKACDLTERVWAFAEHNQELTVPARAAELQQAWIDEFP